MVNFDIGMYEIVTNVDVDVEPWFEGYNDVDDGLCRWPILVSKKSPTS